MRAGDDEDGRGAHQGLLGIAARPPPGEGDDPRGDGHVEEEGRGPVGQGLRPRGRGLGGGDEAHDPRQRRRLADRADPDAQAAARRDRAGHDRIAGSLGDGARLARDHRLVDVGLTVLDAAVGGDPAAGSHEHEVADRQRRDGHALDLVADDPLGRVGQQLGERRERAARLGDRAHLQPVAEQHDRDERGELPPDLDLEDARAWPPSWSRRRP